MTRTSAGGRPPKLPKTDLVILLDTLEQLKATLAGVLSAYARDELPETKARTLIYGIRAGLDVLAAEKEGDLERRLAMIEDALRDLQHANGRLSA